MMVRRLPRNFTQPNHKSVMAPLTINKRTSLIRPSQQWEAQNHNRLMAVNHHLNQPHVGKIR